jgi:two-component system sensor histidine kinase/response regulator
LGLAISEKLLKLMDGKIWVESEPGKGSTFSFTIKTKQGIKVLPVTAQHNMADHEGKKILVVDDNLTNQAILKSQLELWKLVPVLAGSGQEALDILSQDQQFDLILSDMQMPFMDGVMLAEQIKDQHAHIPIILLSSVGDEFTNTHRQLFNSVLTKPIKLHVLGKHILNGLEQQDKDASEVRTVQEKLPHYFSEKYPLNILIAEDNLFNQQVITHILTKMGYKPTLVENGEQAVDAVRATHYDLILMDMQMPEMDGLQATRLIREKLEKQPIIIALTANTMQGDEEACLNAGMNDYMGKPIKLEEVIAKLEKWALYRMKMAG